MSPIPAAVVAPRAPRESLPADIAAALPGYRDPEVLCFSEGPDTPPYDAATVGRMYAFMNRGGEGYIIEVREGDAWRPVGDCALHRETLPIVIGEGAYRSRGIGRRVLGLLIARAKRLRWQRLAVRRVYTYNFRSRRLHEGAGFQLIGTHTDSAGQAVWSFALNLEDSGA